MGDRRGLTPYGVAVSLVLAAGSLLDTDAFGVLDAAAAAGFDGVGLRLSGEHAADPARIAASARALGLRIHDVEVHRITADAPRPEALLDAAAAVGAAHVLVVSDLRQTDTDTTAMADRGARAATIDAVGSLVELAAERGLRIGLEYMAWTEPVEPLDALAVAAATGAVVVVDVLHHTRVGAGPEELRAIAAAGRLGWVQLCDGPTTAPADLLHEARHARLLPGAGGLPLAALVGVVPAGTTISVEVQSDDLLAVPPAERARRLHATTRDVLDAIDALGRPDATAPAATSSDQTSAMAAGDDPHRPR